MRVRIIVMLIRMLPVMAAATVALTGCAAFSRTAARPDDGHIDVVAAFYPLQYVADRVGGGLVGVSDLTRPGQEPHDLELSPKETAQVALADLVVYEKGLQASVDASIKQSSAERVDAAAVGGLQPMSHPEHGGAGELDPHFWQDPLKLAKVSDAVADRLSALDPAHASTYRSNAAALDADLTALDREYATS